MTSSASFEHSYLDLGAPFHAPTQLDGFSSPSLIAWNKTLAQQLGLNTLGDDPEQLAKWFSGSEPLPDSQPAALAYAGHQFGHFVPLLGDGRAALLGEVVDQSGVRRNIQLKGSGRTAYSRNGDGKSSLGPVLREYILSEAMHVLGVPTTRALAAVASGEQVYRQQAEPGGVFTRVAASHLRVGTFQYAAASGDRDALRALADYAIERHDPAAMESDQPYLAFYEGVVSRQSWLVAKWLSLGFIHGVMNTDNTAISGETIDYGPCAFMDEYRADKVFSSIDQHGRYAYANQPRILHWNMARLAECLLLLDEDVDSFQAALDRCPDVLSQAHLKFMGAKLGLREAQAEDLDLISSFLAELEKDQRDFTLSFRALSDRVGAKDENRFGEFESRWKARLKQQGDDPEVVQAMMNSVNPKFIPRNHQVERAIQAGFSGDFSVFHELNAVLRNPYDEQPQFEAYAEPPEPEQRVTQTFCGT